ncbi:MULTISPECIES: hypothetical protein [Moorena]|nr:MULTISPECIES: hypothetical protein [Moorena]NEQ16059.1 hypothetical protein [Moorena sp. SIO3E2]NEP31071.1 hypothetical protein [Moorena sp. SIO3B2]NEP66350.1 hypothetical protein [Moorena sp. SIO3A5]NEQ05122.1 hypothetical protein [Moorena sp. SIO4E2]NER85715.1 hypothetical protein [Moorena sp. SIO3A2]
MVDKRVDNTGEIQSIILALLPTPYSLLPGLWATLREQTQDESTSSN